MYGMSDSIDYLKLGHMLLLENDEYHLVHLCDAPTSSLQIYSRPRTGLHTCPNVPSKPFDTPRIKLYENAPC